MIHKKWMNLFTCFSILCLLSACSPQSEIEIIEPNVREEDEKPVVKEFIEPILSPLEIDENQAELLRLFQIENNYCLLEFEIPSSVQSILLEFKKYENGKLVSNGSGSIGNFISEQGCGKIALKLNEDQSISATILKDGMATWHSNENITEDFVIRSMASLSESITIPLNTEVVIWLIVYSNSSNIEAFSIEDNLEELPSDIQAQQVSITFSDQPL